MSRSVDASVKAELDSGSWREGRLISLEWDGGTDYIWTGIGDLLFDGDTYKGLGDFLGMSSVVEDAENVASGIEITLNGISSGNLANALANAEQGNEVIVRYAVFDTSWSIIGTPVIVFSGFMDVPTIVSDGSSSHISITVEDHRIDLEKPNELRYTDADQKALHAGDTFCKHVAGNKTRESFWGR